MLFFNKMNPNDYSAIMKVLSNISNRLEVIERLTVQIASELNINRGTSIHNEIGAIRESLRNVTNDINTGEVKSLKNMMNSLQKSIEYIQNKNYE